MDSVTNKTRLAEKRYRNKLRKDKKEIGLKNEKHKKQNEKNRKTKENCNNYNHQLRKTKNTTKLQKKKQYESNRRRVLIRKQNESNIETKKLNERRQKRENIVEVTDLGRFFELATTNKRYVIGLNLQEIKIEFLEHYTGDFQLIGSMMIGEIEQKTNIRFKNVNDFGTYINAIDNSGYDSEVVFYTGRLYKLNTP